MNIDYKEFVPCGAQNFIRIDGKTFPLEKIMTITINMLEEKIYYWINFKITDKDYFCMKDHSLDPNKHVEMILLLENNPYKIYGISEIHYNFPDNLGQFRSITAAFTVKDISQTISCSRKEEKEEILERSELLDFD
jgi:hypothetical protein